MNVRTWLWCFWLCLVCSTSRETCQAGSAALDPIPSPEGVKITERLNVQVPLDLEFTDQEGKTGTLRRFFNGQKPVVLTLNYSSCPMLCNLQLTGFARSLRELEWSVGKEFDIVTISIDPKEDTEHAKSMQQKLIADYGRPEAQSGWHVLTGKEADIQAVAKSVGFGYRYNPERKEYEHAAVMMFLTPDGRISSYRYGWEFPGGVLKLTLLDASQGKLGSILEQVVQYCLVYDSKDGKNKLVIFNLVKLVGVATLVFLACFLGTLWLWEYRRHKKVASVGSSS